MPDETDAPTEEARPRIFTTTGDHEATPEEQAVENGPKVWQPHTHTEVVVDRSADRAEVVGGTPDAPAEPDQ